MLAHACKALGAFASTLRPGRISRHVEGQVIRRLAYVSRPEANLSLVEIPRIVAACRRNNTAAGLSGVLLFTGLDFAQLIEGEAVAVANLWARLQTDRRHRDLVVFLDESVEMRWFSDWRLGFPSDSVLVAQIGAWRHHTGPWDQAAKRDLRRLLFAADTL